MVRSEFIERMVTDHPHLDPQIVSDAVVRFFEEITGHLAKGGRVEARGFGVFSVRTRTEQMVRNLRTGEKLSQAEKPGPFFKPGKPLRKRLMNQTG
jgi:integration host factor subunit beta